MTNECTLTIKGREVDFVFDNNSLFEFCDIVKIDISGFENYIINHPGSFMRSLFYAGAKTAARYKNVLLSVEDGKDGHPVVMDEMRFGLEMANFTEADYNKLVKAFEASRPEEKKKEAKKKRILRNRMK